MSTDMNVTTPHLADACLRLGLPIRCAPHTVRPLVSNSRVSGRACPVQHFGSVDVFIEALAGAGPGDVLIVDNGGRLDEACVGDLVALEVKNAGLAGIVIWGLHRDTAEISEIGIPLFSLGAFPVGPQRLDERTSEAFKYANVGSHRVTLSDFVVADDDGAIFLPLAMLGEIFDVANKIRVTEERQSTLIHSGRSLREQLDFAKYLSRRKEDPNYSLRMHLRAKDAAIEE